MSLYNYHYGITEQITPDENIDIEEVPEIVRCSSCGDNVIDFTIHKFYVLCSDCQKEQSHRSLDQMVDAIKYRNSKLNCGMNKTMNSIKNLSNEVLNNK